MRKSLTLIILGFCSVAYTQVGINTTAPAATLDVVGKPDVISEMDGVIPPRITGDQLAAKTYSTAQKGSVIYVTINPSSASTNPQTINVISAGLYYFDGAVWQKISVNNIYNSDGTLTGNRTVQQNANTLIFNTTASSGIKFIGNGTVAAPKPVVQIVDGSQASDFVLTSDASGNATWRPISLGKVIGTIVAGSEAKNSFLNNSTSSKNLGSYIDLPPGSWEVEINVLLDVASNVADSYTWAKFSLGDSSTGSAMSSDIVGNSKLVSGDVTTVNVKGDSNSFYGIANGRIGINNTTAENKRYYLLFMGANYKGAVRTIYMMGTTAYAENYISAIRVK